MQKRHIWDQLKSELTTDEILVIAGPRQVGKTVTLQWLLDQIPSKNRLYIDLENLADRQLFEVPQYETVMDELARRGISKDERLYLALDEIQLLPQLPSVIKYLYDRYRIKFILSGSSSFYIKNRFSESMAGRKLLFEMFPLSFSEFLDFKGVSYQLPTELDIKSLFSPAMYAQLGEFYQEYVSWGGLPRVVLTTDVERKKRLLQEIFSSYINLDVQGLSDIADTHNLRRLIELLAVRIGSKCNVTELANILGLTRVTVSNYLTILEQSYLVRSVPSYSNSPSVRLRLPRKIYFIDTGIASTVADLSGGSKLENTVCHQLNRYGQLAYYSDQVGEIDFVLQTPATTLGVEVKQTPTARDATRLRRRAQKIDITNTRLIGQSPVANFKDYLWGGGIS